MTKEELQSRALVHKYLQFKLDDFDYLEWLDEEELDVLKDVFYPYKIANRVTENGNIPMALPEDTNVRYMLPYSAFREYFMSLYLNEIEETETNYE